MKEESRCIQFNLQVSDLFPRAVVKMGEIWWLLCLFLSLFFFFSLSKHLTENGGREREKKGDDVFFFSLSRPHSLPLKRSDHPLRLKME